MGCPDLESDAGKAAHWLEEAKDDLERSDDGNSPLLRYAAVEALIGAGHALLDIAAAIRGQAGAAKATGTGD